MRTNAFFASKKNVTAAETAYEGKFCVSISCPTQNMPSNAFYALRSIFCLKTHFLRRDAQADGVVFKEYQ